MKNLIRLAGGRLLARLLRLRSKAYSFSPAPAVVVAPHADDETLGCGGFLAAKSELGQSVHVVFMTDSAGSAESAPAAHQAMQRQQEALAALATLGVSANQVHFFALPDGRLNRLTASQSAEASAALAALLHRLQPGEVFVPYHGGGSTEHDATTDLVLTVVATTASAPRVLEYPVWAWWDFRRLSGQLLRSRQNFHFDLGSRRARKQKALACHASQVDSPTGTSPALPAVLAALCTGPTEFYFHRQP